MSMSNIVEEWNNTRIRYQNRYYGACKKLKTGETNTDNHGAMLEMSYVLISIFGLSPKEIEEVEKNGGFTNKDLKEMQEETKKRISSAITKNVMNAIAGLMDSEKREAVHREFAPCTYVKFLEEYCKKDPQFEDVLKNEFGIML